MFSLLSRKGKAGDTRPPRGGLGRTYAIGDVHGRFDLFVGMLRLIEDDLAKRPIDIFKIIFLGDLIDRGPQSADIIELAEALSRSTSHLQFLKGNHEELFLRAFAGDAQAASFFYSVGGRETLMSYGLDCAEGDAMSGEQLVAWMKLHITDSHIRFISRFDDMIQSGDFIFVHAGIKPHVPLHRQTISDLRWIRNEFLNCETLHPGVIVHGHSITQEVEERPNRIGIDTGAYFSGRLTAIAIEGDDRWYLTATDDAAVTAASAETVETP